METKQSSGVQCDKDDAGLIISQNTTSSEDSTSSAASMIPSYDQDKFGEALVYLLKSLNAASGDARRKLLLLLNKLFRKHNPTQLIQHMEMPMLRLIELFVDGNTSTYTANLVLHYLLRLYTSMRVERRIAFIPHILRAVNRNRTEYQNDEILNALLPILRNFHLSENIEKRYRIFLSPNSARFTMDHMLEWFTLIMMLPYGFKIPESFSEPISHLPIGFTRGDFFRCIGNGNRLRSADDLENAKLGILRFCSSNVFQSQDFVILFIIGEGDSRVQVANLSSDIMSAFQRRINWDQEWLILCILRLIANTHKAKEALEAKKAPSTPIREKKGNFNIFSFPCQAVRARLLLCLCKSERTVFTRCSREVLELVKENISYTSTSLASRRVQSACFQVVTHIYKQGIHDEAISYCLLIKITTYLHKTTEFLPEDTPVRLEALKAFGQIIRSHSLYLFGDIQRLAMLFEDLLLEKNEDIRRAIVNVLLIASCTFQNASVQVVKQIQRESLSALRSLLIKYSAWHNEKPLILVALHFAINMFPPHDIPPQYIILEALLASDAEVRKVAIDHFTSCESRHFCLSMVGKKLRPDFVGFMLYETDFLTKVVPSGEKEIVFLITFLQVARQCILLNELSPWEATMIQRHNISNATNLMYVRIISLMASDKDSPKRRALNLYFRLLWKCLSVAQRPLQEIVFYGGLDIMFYEMITAAPSLCLTIVGKKDLKEKTLRQMIMRECSLGDSNTIMALSRAYATICLFTDPLDVQLRQAQEFVSRLSTQSKITPNSAFTESNSAATSASGNGGHSDAATACSNVHHFCVNVCAASHLLDLIREYINWRMEDGSQHIQPSRIQPLSNSPNSKSAPRSSEENNHSFCRFYYQADQLPSCATTKLDKVPPSMEHTINELLARIERWLPLIDSGNNSTNGSNRISVLNECALASLLVLSAHGCFQHLPLKLSSAANSASNEVSSPGTDWTVTASSCIGKRPLRSVLGVFYYCWSIVIGSKSNSSQVKEASGLVSATSKSNFGASSFGSSNRPPSSNLQTAQQPIPKNIRMIAVDILTNLVSQNKVLIPVSIDVLQTYQYDIEEEEVFSTICRFLVSCVCSKLVHQPLTYPWLWLEHSICLDSTKTNIQTLPQASPYSVNERVIQYLHERWHVLRELWETARIEISDESELTPAFISAYNKQAALSKTYLTDKFLFVYVHQWLQRLFILPISIVEEENTPLSLCLELVKGQMALLFLSQLIYHMSDVTAAVADSLCKSAMRASVFLYNRLSMENKAQLAQKVTSRCGFSREKTASNFEWYNVRHFSPQNSSIACRILCALSEMVNCVEMTYPLFALYFLTLDEMEEYSLQTCWRPMRPTNNAFHCHVTHTLIQELRGYTVPYLGDGAAVPGLLPVTPRATAPQSNKHTEEYYVSGTSGSRSSSSSSASQDVDDEQLNHCYRNEDDPQGSEESQMEEEGDDVDAEILDSSKRSESSRKRRIASGQQPQSTLSHNSSGNPLSTGKRVNALLSLHVHALLFCYHPEEVISQTMICVMKSLYAILGSEELPSGGVGLLLHDILYLLRTQRQSRTLLFMTLSAFRQMISFEQTRLTKSDWREYGPILLGIFSEMKRYFKYFHQSESHRDVFNVCSLSPSATTGTSSGNATTPTTPSTEETPATEEGKLSITSKLSVPFLLALVDDVTRAIHMLFLNAPSNKLKVAYIMTLCEWLVSDLHVLIQKATKFLRSIFDSTYVNTGLLTATWLSSPLPSMPWRKSTPPCGSNAPEAVPASITSASSAIPRLPSSLPPLLSSTQLRRLVESLFFAVALAETEAATAITNISRAVINTNGTPSSTLQQDWEERSQLSDGESGSSRTFSSDRVLLKKSKKLLVTEVGICGREALLSCLDNLNTNSSVESLVVPLVDCIRSPDNAYYRQLATEFIIRACQRQTRGLSASSGKLLAALLHGILSPSVLEAKWMGRAIALLMPHAKDTAIQRIFSRVRQWYLEFDPSDVRYERAALYLMLSACTSCPMVLRTHYKQVVPLVFVAMAKNIAVKDRNMVRGNVTVPVDHGMRVHWETVWREMLNDASTCVQAYFTDILAFIEDCLTQHKHLVRCDQACFALVVLSNEDYFTHEQQAKAYYQMIFTIFSEDVNAWERKTLLFRSIYGFTSTRVSKRMEGNFESIDKQCIEILKFEASRCDNAPSILNHNIEALYMLAYTADVLGMDVFADAYVPLKQCLASGIVRDQENPDLSSSDTFTYEESIMAVIPLLWPNRAYETHKRFLHEILSWMCSNIDRPHWGRRLYTLNALVETLKKTDCQDVLQFPNIEPVLQTLFKVMKRCAKEAKSPNVRFQLLNCVDLLLPSTYSKFRDFIEKILRSLEKSSTLDETFGSRISLLRDKITKLDAALTITNV